VISVKIAHRMRFARQIIYYALRYFSEKNSKTNKQMCGYSFDSIFHKINLDGFYECDELHSIFEFLKQKTELSYSLVLDIGANIGNHTVYFSRFFSSVYAFEPNPKIFHALRFNTENLAHVHLYPYALGNATGVRSFCSIYTNLGASHLIEDQSAVSAHDAYFQIDLRKLDDFPEFFDKKIDLIKIDVEGYELSVLQGGINLLQKNCPCILFEQTANSFENGTSNTISFLKKMGYSFYVGHENFYFGDSVFSKMLTLLLQDLFGKKIVFRKMNFFKKRFYSLIIALKTNV
jgi:FkbM family methyltransferase